MPTSQSREPGQLVHQTLVDLHAFPKPNFKPISDERNQYTLGDLHANALKLTHFLAYFNVLQISPENYNTIATLTSSHIDAVTPENLRQFADIMLNQTRYNPVGLIRLLGDDLADRRLLDWYVLLTIKSLSINKVNLEILFSNHTAEFMLAYQRWITGLTPELQPPIFPDNAGIADSLYNLKKLIKKGWISRDEVQQIYEQHYLPHCKALSYSLSEDNSKISIYTHAGVGLETIRGLVYKLNIAKLSPKAIKHQIPYYADIRYDDSTPATLACTIDLINAAYQEYLKKNCLDLIFSTKCVTMMVNVEYVYDFDPDTEAFERLCWSRNYSRAERPAMHNGYRIDYIHGHDIQTPLTARHIVSIDNNHGKDPLWDTAYFICHYSQDLTKPTLAPTESKLSDDALFTPTDNPYPALFARIEDLLEFGYDIGSKDIQNLAAQIKHDAHAYLKNYNPEACCAQDFNLFLTDIRRQLHHIDPEMTPIKRFEFTTIKDRILVALFNVGIALTGIGLIAIAGQLIYSKTTTGRFTLFGERTAYQTLQDKIDYSLDQLPPPRYECLPS